MAAIVVAFPDWPAATGVNVDWYDISVPIEPGMPVWEGDPPVQLERFAAIVDGSVANVSRLACGVHTGTHIDAPIHFIDGAAAAEATPLGALIGPAVVIDATSTSRPITAADIAGLAIPNAETRVLLKTSNSALWQRPGFTGDFVGLDESAAQALVDHGVQLVGIDYLSIAPYDAPVPTHQVLLGAGVVVVEGLDLRAIEPGEYELACLPLKLVGSDGAPARAVLRRRAGTTTEAGPREAM